MKSLSYWDLVSLSSWRDPFDVPFFHFNFWSHVVTGTLYTTVLMQLKPVTDEQVFYDKLSYDKFYLRSARVYMQYILYDKFSYDKFYFTGVNVSTSLL